jgi:hypothetical protein
MAKRRRQRSVIGKSGGGTQRGSVAERDGVAQPATRTQRPQRARPAVQPRGLLGGADPWRLGIVGAVVLGVLVLVVAVFAGSGSGGRYTCGQQLAAGGTPEDGQVTADLGRQHVATGSQLTYLFCPSTSGLHYSESGVAPARPGYYRPDADIGPGSWVHNLEHGYVVALYRCTDDVCPSEEVLAELRRFVNNGPPTDKAAACGYRSKVLAARFDDMSTPFALLAWNRALLLDSFDADAALDFAQRWIEKDGPESLSGC